MATVFLLLLFFLNSVALSFYYMIRIHFKKKTMYLFVSVFLSYVCVALIGNCDIYRDRPLVLIFFFSWAPKGWPGNPDIELTFADYFHLIRIVWSLINLALNSRSSVESVQALYTCSSNHFFFFHILFNRYLHVFASSTNNYGTCQYQEGWPCLQEMCSCHFLSVHLIYSWPSVVSSTQNSKCLLIILHASFTICPASRHDLQSF